MAVVLSAETEARIVAMAAAANLPDAEALVSYLLDSMGYSSAQDLTATREALAEAEQQMERGETVEAKQFFTGVEREHEISG